MISPRNRLPTRALLFACSSIAALGLTVLGLRAADVLSIGPHPDSSAFDDFLLSSGAGLLLGFSLVAYSRFLYRHHRNFYVEFHAAPLLQRLRWRFLRWNLLYSLPILFAWEGFFVFVMWRESDPLPGLFAFALCLPLVSGSWDEVRRLVAERRQIAGTPGNEIALSESQWNTQAASENYVGRMLLWLALIAALAFTGHTVALPQREQREESWRMVRQLVSHGIAGQSRFYDLTDQARRASRTCDPNRIEAAAESARELLRIYPGFTYDWNYGNAIHFANLVLGRLALRRGDIPEARRSLLRAGETPGSPQISDYGPDMTLARELLERGQSATVLLYFSLCNRFWRNPDRNCIEAWADDVRAGGIPDFGARAGPIPIPDRGWTCELLEAGTERR